ncbi:hypothetical protein [Nonomuraea antimicrobica]
MNNEKIDHLWQTFLANRDPRIIERLMQHSVTLLEPESSEAAELRGLLLLGGDGDVPFAEDSPWGVPTGAGLVNALEHVWAPVAGCSPRFLAALRAEVLGLALVALEGEYLLGYLHVHGGLSDLSGEPPRDLADVPPDYPDVLWATAPTRLNPTDVVPTLAEPLPAPVRDLTAVHASLASSDIDLRLDRFTTTLGASIRANYAGEDPADYDETDDFVRAVNGEFDRRILFCTCRSAAEAYFLDMADRDPDDIPRVALSGVDGTSEQPGTPFWEWVDEALPSLLFCR